MREITVLRAASDEPSCRCPFHQGLTGFAKVGGNYCTKECQYFCGIHPMTDEIYCSCEGEQYE